MALLVAWYQGLPPPEQQSEADRELKMNLDQVYARWEKETQARAKAEGVAEGMAEGEVKGMAKSVLKVLEGRGLTVTTAQRKQVLACTDTAQLDAWLRAAGTTASTKELLSTAAPSRARTKRS